MKSYIILKVKKFFIYRYILFENKRISIFPYQNLALSKFYVDI